MKPLREHVALAIDGGGIKGVMVTRALAILEEHLGQGVHDIFRLAAGTSTGSIISTGTAVGLTAERMYQLYMELGEVVFRKTLRSRLWPMMRYRYPTEVLQGALEPYLSHFKMHDFWEATPQTDLVITTFDLLTERTRFIKPWKEEYADWPAIQAVLASCSVPTYFPPVEGRYVDGGVGSYANPCYLAAYEATFCLHWDPAQTTLISLGTGRDPATLAPGDPERLQAWDWIGEVVGAFLHSAEDQQAHLVHALFEKIDFRRFQVPLVEAIEMDDPAAIPLLVAYGEELGRKILADEIDPVMDMVAGQPAS